MLPTPRGQPVVLGLPEVAHVLLAAVRPRLGGVGGVGAAGGGRREVVAAHCEADGHVELESIVILTLKMSEIQSRVGKIYA